MSGLVKFSLDQLNNLDYGRAVAAFELELQRAVRDCADRPGDKRVRKVTLQMNVLPVPTVEGNTIDCDEARATFTTQCKLPPYETQPVSFGIKQNGSLVFNPDSPKNYRQTTFDEIRDTE